MDWYDRIHTQSAVDRMGQEPTRQQNFVGSPIGGMPTMRIIFFLIAMLSAFPVFSETRVAFLVGNANYQHAVALDNPRNDVDHVAKSLRSLGFEVVLHYDLERRNLGRELTSFLNRTKGADLTLFYFAGHGMQFEGQNFILGTDAKLETEFDIDEQPI